MQDLGPDAFPRHLSGLLFDDARAHHWVTAVHDMALARARSLPATRSPSGSCWLDAPRPVGETARAAEAALGRSVARRTLRSNVVRDAARLAEEVAVASSAGRERRRRGHAPVAPRRGSRALRCALPRGFPSGVGARRGERPARRRARDAAARRRRARASAGDARPRSARGRGPRGATGVDEDDESRSGASAGARAFSAACDGRRRPSATGRVALACGRRARARARVPAPDARAPTR